MLFVLADITATQLQRTCGRDPEWLCRETLERTESHAIAQAADVIVGRPLTIVLILLGALLVHRLIGRAIERGLRGLSSGVVRERMGAARRRAPAVLTQQSEAGLRTEQRISAITSVLRSVAGFVIALFACFAVLSEIGVEVAPLLAGAGVVGVALGFGSQSLVKDFLSGMFILVEDQFGVGDVVELDGQTSGTVEAVSLRTTRLRAADGTVWHVPNGAIIRVGNKSQRAARAAEVLVPAGEAAAPHAGEVEVKPSPDDAPRRRDEPPVR